ncbi:response regulator transcription factor [Gracilibacillus kekensis]|uniref:Two-component system, response regulator YesN n=1 Tax=Gracilibacillus kekensis TaxID=1027249 RepID=A0A1M7JJW0_9BACI|nr:response regulator [Gracilibacillus kekensis]SHM53215.1 two-component system, response regulator YesN [Gracilibacillus kekensis]
MIRVLLVEDDKLVRKSLISSFNWEAFDMKVVGDAKHGEKALEFLEAEEVDLIITDLAMPIMSGTELIRKVKEKYSDIHVVVLSLHRDFDYIQEAMRLGAIDYIAKVELDNEEMDKTLKRIHDRIKLDEQPLRSTEKTEIQAVNKGYFLITDEEIDKYEKRFRNEFTTLSIVVLGVNVLYIDYEVNITDVKKHATSELHPNEQILLVEIDSNHKLEMNELESFVRKYIDSIFFYEVEKTGILSFYTLKSANIIRSRATKEEIQKLKEELISLKWCRSDDLLEKTLYDLRELRLAKNKLMSLLLLTIHECRRIYADILAVDLSLPDEFRSWQEVEKWFRETKEIIHQKIFYTSVSEETTACIIEAIQIIEKKLDTSITANEIAKDVNMSRSYFSICFKQVVGNTFNEYVRVARIRKAKNFLLFTTEKVSVISEKVGYADVKYFSKVFKKSTGLLPSEYRKQQSKE